MGQRPATRILATLGPASWSSDTITALARAGASAFRLNFSHGDHEILERVIADVRAIEGIVGRPIAILGDLAGPKLRTGPVDDAAGVPLTPGEEVVVTSKDEVSSRGRIAVTYRGLPSLLAPGHRVLLDDGKLEVEVIDAGEDEVRARVVYGGVLGSNKGLNLPGSRVNIPSITEKDAADIAFALAHDVDWLALSFVQEARDVVDLKRRISSAGRSTPVIAKIEKPLAVKNLGQILDVSDGIMVARGDLGVELGPEQLPTVQKEIIERARVDGKLVVTATQMLESMTQAPRPTRAEASDVANAIFDGTDVVMLSQETAIGDYPVRAVETMRDIALQVESSSLFRGLGERFRVPTHGGIAQAAIRAACIAAEEVGAKAIVPFTGSGWTALSVSCWRPATPICAITFRASTCRRLALCRAVHPVLVPEESASLDERYLLGIDALLRAGRLKGGDVVVILSGGVLHGHGANTVKIYRVGEDDLADAPETRERLRHILGG